MKLPNKLLQLAGRVILGMAAHMVIWVLIPLLSVTMILLITPLLLLSALVHLIQQVTTQQT